MATTGWTVIGTDTGVGKTVVAAAVAANFVAAGRQVAVAKTVQTGTADDTAEVNRLVGQPVGRQGWKIPRPLDPFLAARLGGDRLFPGDLVQWTLRALTGVDIGLIDTNGGCATELNEGFNNSDLASAVGLGVIVVCRPGQGTLNHSIMTCDHLRAQHADIAGLVVSRMPRQPTIVEAATMGELERLTRYPIIGVIPDIVDVFQQIDPVGFAAIAADGLDKKLGGRFDREAFLDQMAALV
ncbi:MAG: dethiobiotin synthetase [Chloroflexota bacterium]|jgi:dethiobiotin synthetase|nr:dethiobiotin synthetase [Chloroflexota bacterium]